MYQPLALPDTSAGFVDRSHMHDDKMMLAIPYQVIRAADIRCEVFAILGSAKDTPATKSFLARFILLSLLFGKEIISAQTLSLAPTGPRNTSFCRAAIHSLHSSMEQQHSMAMQ